MKVANFLTALRIGLMPLLLFLISTGSGYEALAVLLLAGATDILDGYLARRLGQASKFGAFFDLLADRLLTLTLSIGLIMAGNLPAYAVVAIWILISRDFLVAGLNETFPDKLNIRVNWLERIKIALQFLGFGALLSSASVTDPDTYQILSRLGALSLAGSACLCALTLTDYLNRARKSFVR